MVAELPPPMPVIASEFHPVPLLRNGHVQSALVLKIIGRLSSTDSSTLDTHLRRLVAAVTTS